MLCWFGKKLKRIKRYNTKGQTVWVIIVETFMNFYYLVVKGKLQIFENCNVVPQQSLRM